MWFFGGGTPSLMQPETTAAVLDAVRKSFRVANDLEVTLEANPTSVEASRLDGFRDAGVNRVSLGVQALDDAQRMAQAMHAAQAFLECQRRSEEHTSELQSLMRNSYAVFCLKKKQTITKRQPN